MAKWGMSEPEKVSNDQKEKWEYARFLFNWQQDYMDLGNGKRLRWGETWEMFDRMGDDGWEMITASPISAPVLGHGPGDTNHFLFILKRRKVSKKAN